MNTHKRLKKKIKGNHPTCIVFIKSTQNNILLYATTPAYKTIAWTSAGSVGFKGFKKSTPFAAQEAANALSTKLKDLGVKTISFVLNGINSNRDAAITKFKANGFLLNAIMERTGYAFGGCRPPGERSV